MICVFAHHEHQLGHRPVRVGQDVLRDNFHKKIHEMKEKHMKNENVPIVFHHHHHEQHDHYDDGHVYYDAVTVPIFNDEIYIYPKSMRVNDSFLNYDVIEVSKTIEQQENNPLNILKGITVGIMLNCSKMTSCTTCLGVFGTCSWKNNKCVYNEDGSFSDMYSVCDPLDIQEFQESYMVYAQMVQNMISTYIIYIALTLLISFIAVFTCCCCCCCLCFRNKRHERSGRMQRNQRQYVELQQIQPEPIVIQPTYAHPF